jgi:dihydrodipicolinate reductase
MWNANIETKVKTFTCLSANKAMVIGTMGFNDAGLTNLNNAKN